MWGEERLDSGLQGDKDETTTKSRGNTGGAEKWQKTTIKPGCFSTIRNMRRDDEDAWETPQQMTNMRIGSPRGAVWIERPVGNLSSFHRSRGGHHDPRRQFREGGGEISPPDSAHQEGNFR